MQKKASCAIVGYRLVVSGYNMNCNKENEYG